MFSSKLCSRDPKQVIAAIEFEIENHEHLHAAFIKREMWAAAEEVEARINEFRGLLSSITEFMKIPHLFECLSNRKKA